MQINIIKKQYEKICKRIQTLNERIRQLPEGYLSCVKNGKYSSNYFRKCWNDKPTYIPKEQTDFAAMLALREYYELQLKEAEINRDYLAKVIKLLENKKSVRTLSDAKQELITKYYFPNKGSDKSANYSESIIFKTLSGTLVRSKSEVLIANVYTEFDLSYNYESELKIGNYVFNPDFKVYHPVSGLPIYHEHFGMMDDDSYAKKAKWKIARYAEQGYLPFENIIYTFESSDAPLDIQKIRELISAVFF